MRYITSLIIKQFFLLTLMFHCGIALASHYKQRISLHVTTKGQHQSSARGAICFKSSDFLDRAHCGSSSNSYSWGPKNWQLFPRIDLDDYSNSNRQSIPDHSCQSMIKQGARTPDENGRLDIYVEVEHAHKYDEYGNLLLDINYFRHCRSRWSRG